MLDDGNGMERAIVLNELLGSAEGGWPCGPVSAHLSSPSSCAARGDCWPGRWAWSSGWWEGS